MIMAVALLSTTNGHDKHNDIENIDCSISDNQQIIVPGKGVSRELLTEFQIILKKCLEKSEETSSILVTQPNLITGSNDVCGKRDSPDERFYNLSDEEQNRMYVIYVQMDDKQRKEQEIIFVSPMFSSPNTVFPQPHSPLSDQLKFWNDPTQIFKERDKQKFEIWIDGVKVDNNVLNSYTATDFSGYFVSVLHAVERFNEFRVDLWTTTGYQDFCQKYFDQPVSIDKLLEIKPRIGFCSDLEKHSYSFVLYENIMFAGSQRHSFALYPPPRERKISQEKKEEIETCITYFTNHLPQMNYSTYLSEKKPIGSGVIEAACKVIIKQRMCNSGMKWTDDGAKNVLVLRCFNETDGKWEQFWNKITKMGY